MAALDQASLWLLYFVCFAMPVTGHLMSGNGKPVSYFGLFLVPGFPKGEAVDQFANALHLAGQWVVYALVLLHVGATAWHVAVRRDGLLSRMLPRGPNTLPPVLEKLAYQYGATRSSGSNSGRAELELWGLAG